MAGDAEGVPEVMITNVPEGKRESEMLAYYGDLRLGNRSDTSGRRRGVSEMRRDLENMIFFELENIILEGKQHIESKQLSFRIPLPTNKITPKLSLENKSYLGDRCETF